jgi:hypothetical protein
MPSAGGEVVGRLVVRPRGRRPPRLPPLLRFLLRHLVAGSIGGFVLGGLILWQDLAGLKTMIIASPDRGLVLFMLFFGLWITFGSLAMAIGIMQLGEERD